MNDIVASVDAPQRGGAGAPKSEQVTGTMIRSLRKAGSRTSLKVRAGAQCDKILFQEPCRVPLTSRIQQSVVGSHATATVSPSFFAAIAAAGSLHCAEQLAVA